MQFVKAVELLPMIELSLEIVVAFIAQQLIRFLAAGAL
jgi:hypothetical protein